MLMRYLFGFSGDSLTSGAVDDGAVDDGAVDDGAVDDGAERDAGEEVEADITRVLQRSRSGLTAGGVRHAVMP